jgi:hypothetical protein
MATTTSTIDYSDISYKFYNGGWSGWLDALTGGYAGSTSRVVVLKFATPSGSYFGSNLKIKIPYVRQATTAEKGKLFVKLYKSNPIKDDSEICAIPTSSTCDASYSWSTSDQQVHIATFTLSDISIERNTTYYLVIGASTNFMQIGYKGYDDEYSISYDSYTITNGGKPALNAVDKGNNTVVLSGTLGKNGDYNEIKSAVLYYTTDGTDPSSSSSNRTRVSLTASSAASYSKSVTITKACTIKAYITCTFEYNTTTDTASVTAKYYVGPKNPGKPYLVDSSFKNSRLTTKQDWGWQWTLAEAGNASTYNAVKGYRVRLFINNVNSPIVNYYTGNITSKELDDSDWAYDRTSTDYPMPMRATNQSIKPGDTVKLSIQAYSVDGADNKLLSSAQVSKTYTVQNAGIVNIKVGGSYKEGQVYVKVNGTWQEAETVSAKVNGEWKESQ